MGSRSFANDMRVRFGWIAIFVLPFANGCSCFIAKSGLELSTLTTRNDVYSEFGIPVNCNLNICGTSEEYLTRRKIADQFAHAYAPALLMTGGLCEVMFFPLEVTRQARYLISGRQVEFEYDSDGVITGIWLDGNQIVNR